MLLHQYLFIYAGSGPLWVSQVRGWLGRCDRAWLPSLAFVSNFWPGHMSDFCLKHLWYLPNDMQLFLVALPLLWLFFRSRWLFYSALSLMFAGCVLAVALLTHSRDISAGVFHDEGSRFNDLIYIKPWGNYASYAFGLVLGVLYFEFKQSDSDLAYHNCLSARFFRTM